MRTVIRNINEQIESLIEINTIMLMFGIRDLKITFTTEIDDHQLCQEIESVLSGGTEAWNKDDGEFLDYWITKTHRIKLEALIHNIMWDTDGDTETINLNIQDFNTFNLKTITV